MLVNIQQPVIQSDGTLLLATDSKVQMLCALGIFLLTPPSFYVLCCSVYKMSVCSPHKHVWSIVYFVLMLVIEKTCLRV